MAQKILIIQTASLGDVILSTSLGEILYKQYPDASIDYLIKKGYQQLFNGHPFVNKVHVWDKSVNKYKNLVNLALKIRRLKYDAVINVQRFASSGFISALSGASFRSGFTKNPLSFTFSHKVAHDIKGNIHEIYRNLELIKPLISTELLRPRLYPTSKDLEFTQQWKSKFYVTISPASLYFTKQLPAGKWIELIQNLSTSTNVILLGGQQDNTLCETIVDSCKSVKVVNLAGKLTLLQSASIMKDAIMNYVNDSAPQHIASAVNAPVTTVYCSTVPAFGFGPLSDNSTIIETNISLSCRPCGLHGYKKCPEGHFKCAQTISLSQLLLPMTYERRD